MSDFDPYIFERREGPLEVPVIESYGALDNGDAFWVLGIREEGGPFELVGTAASCEEAEEMARAVVVQKNWVRSFIAEQHLALAADLSKVRQLKHPLGGFYYFEPREEE